MPTNWSGLYDGWYSTPYSTIGVANPFRRLRRVFGARASALKAKEIVRTFVTDDVGTTALWTHKRVAAQVGATSGEVASSLGGVRGTETVTDINRAITAGDETALLLEIDAVHTPSTWPTEKSGNSGGGKLGF